MDTINVRPPIWAILAAVIIGGCFYLVGKHLEASRPDPSDRATIMVSGDAKVFAAPDIAELSFGVTTGRQTNAKAAMDKLNTSMVAVLNAVKKAGVEEKDIQTQSLWLSPEFDYNDGTQVPRGFQASQNLSVKVRDMDKVGDVLSAATAAGANQAGGVSFTIDNPDSLRATARDEAIAEAKSKAQELAKSLGVHLGRLQGFSEGGGGYPYPMMNAKMEAGASVDMAQSAVLPAGQQEVNVTVNLTYEVK